MHTVTKFTNVNQNISADNYKSAEIISFVAALYSILGGITTLIGWYYNYPVLTDWTSEGISMFPNTALCSIFCGIALNVDRLNSVKSSLIKSVLYASIFFLILISGLTLGQHIGGYNFGIDTLLVSEPKPWGQTAAASIMRMGLPASVSFLCLGAALILMQEGRLQRKVASNIALLVFFIAFLSLTGYWIGANQLFGIAKITGIAWQTSTIIAALSMGIMLAIPDHGIVSAAFKDDAGGSVLRTLILPLIFVPLLLAWLQIFGESAGYFDEQFSKAIRTILEIIILTVLLWWTASSISRHSSLLAQADKRKDEFLATLSHELRNPLAAIVNSLELIKLSGNSKEKIDLAGSIISRQVGHLVRLVDDLLDLSRISYDKLELKKETFPLAELIRQTTEAVNHLFAEKRQHFAVKIPTDEILLHADLVRMVQILVNLINNASKYTQQDGNISITAETSNAHLILTISDNGAGISAEMLPNVFDIFTQVSRSLEQKTGGLGIGLAIVKRLVELHHGTITVLSPGENKGTTFRLELPVVSKTSVSKIKTAEKSVLMNINKSRIMIVEDNIDTAISLSLLLETHGFEILTLHDGLEAATNAESFKPDLILLDIGLPGMNGFDICKEIRTKEWGAGISIIALTGWGQEKDRQISKESGFTHHLVKPVDHDTLLKIIKIYLANQTAA